MLNFIPNFSQQISMKIIGLEIYLYTKMFKICSWIWM